MVINVTLPMRKMIDSDRKKLHKELDDLWREIIYLQYNYTCEMCFDVMTSEECHAHHVIKRGNFNIRWDLENGSLLCNYNHNFAINAPHQDNEKYIEWFKLHRPQGCYERLLIKSGEKGGALKLEIMELIKVRNNLLNVKSKLLESRMKILKPISIKR